MFFLKLGVLEGKDLDRTCWSDFEVFFKTCPGPHLEIHPPMLVVSFFFWA